ncbi:MAG: hypothetical protein ACKON8_06090, partial [Planctomycetota bacterium]
DYRERIIEKENYACERSAAALVMLSNRNDSGFDSRTVNVDFTLGQRLVELTGNAARANATLGAARARFWSLRDAHDGNRTGRSEKTSSNGGLGHARFRSLLAGIRGETPNGS